MVVVPSVPAVPPVPAPVPHDSHPPVTPRSPRSGWLYLLLLLGVAALLAARVGAQGPMPAIGSLVGWGSNQEGQFGAGQAVGRATPASISRITVGLTSKTVKLLASGVSHSLAVTDDNQIYTWGLNDYGQLGVGDTINRRLPTAVSDLNGLLTGKTIAEVSLGANHTLVRTTDNVLIAWGRNDSGQLGIGDTVQQPHPVAVIMTGAMAGRTVSKIAAGGQHNLVCTTDGNVYAWGLGSSGQTNPFYNIVTSSPILAPNIGVSAGRLVQSVAAGANHSVALLQGGTSLFAWGVATANGSTTTTWNPTAVVMTGTLSGKTVTALASSPGSNHTLVLTSDGMVAGWGQNSNAELGNDSTTTATVPVAATASGFDGKLPVAIYAGQNHSYAVAADGSVFGWGLNTSGQLGNNSLTTLTKPTPVRPAGALSGKTVTPTAYSLGGSYSMAFDSTGQVAVWGTNNSGQLGISNLESFTTPVALLGRDLNSKTFAQVAAGEDFVAALSSDGVVFTWGGNTSGQLGSGAWGTPSNVGAPIAGGALKTSSVSLTGGSVVSGSLQVSVASTTGLVPGLAVTGTHIPPGATVTSVTNATTFQLSQAPTASATGLALSASGQTALPAVTELGVGHRHVLAVAGGRLYAWGDNNNSALGDGSTTTRPTPVLVSGGSLAGKVVAKVAGGFGHSLAIDSSGTLYAWGYNVSGQLGDGSGTTRSTPVAVTGAVTGGALAGRVVTAIAAAANGSFALAGSLAYAWGDNGLGQLGDGTNISRPTPVAVSTAGVLSGKNLTHIAAGFNHVVVRSSDGLLFAWGQNDRGQLGNGTTAASTVPVAVKMNGALAGKTALKVWAGPVSFGTIVLASDGKLYTWGGRGEVGQSGNGQWNINLEPVQVTLAGAIVSAALAACRA
jgi:alpha-tubulin suppressor-like RCC1 family protein